MTHDEIAQLDAAGLRLEVARVKGWKRTDLFPGAWQSTFNGFVIADEELTDWPADIRAAWELVEEMVSAGWDVTIDPGQRITVVSISARCGCNYTGMGDTAPLVICRAYLMYKQG